MTNYYCWIILNKNGNPILVGGHLPIYWRKNVAQEMAANFSGTSVKKIFMDDLKGIISGSVEQQNKELWDENEILKAGLTTALTLWNSLEQAGEIKLGNPELFTEQYDELKKLITL